MWVVLGALRGMGITIEDLIELADATPDDGVVFGETWLEQRRTLQAGVEYTVRGGVRSLVRREGRRAGTFDVLTFELELCAPGGEVAAVSSQSFVIRRGADARCRLTSRSETRCRRARSRSAPSP